MRPDPIFDFAFGSADDSAVASEAILPEQFFRPSAALTPEKRLMLAVLERALLDLQGSAVSRTPRARQLADEVDAWFAADDERWPCSFLNVCQRLGFDVSAVRARVARWQRGAQPNVVTLRIERSDAPANREQSVAAAG